MTDKCINVTNLLARFKALQAEIDANLVTTPVEDSSTLNSPITPDSSGVSEESTGHVTSTTDQITEGSIFYSPESDTTIYSDSLRGQAKSELYNEIVQFLLKNKEDLNHHRRIDNLNIISEKLADIKMNLLIKLYKELTNTTLPISTNNFEQFNKLFTQSLITLEPLIKTASLDQKKRFYQLSRFDNIIADLEVIKIIHPRYIKINNYEYVGPKVKYRTSFTEESYIDSSNYVSTFTKLALNFYKTPNDKAIGYERFTIFGRELLNKISKSSILMRDILALSSSRPIEYKNFIYTITHAKYKLPKEAENLTISEWIQSPYFNFDVFLTELPNMIMKFDTSFISGNSELQDLERGIIQLLSDKDVVSEFKESLLNTMFNTYLATYSVYEIDPQDDTLLNQRDLKTSEDNSKKEDIRKQIAGSILRLIDLPWNSDGTITLNNHIYDPKNIRDSVANLELKTILKDFELTFGLDNLDYDQTTLLRKLLVEGATKTDSILNVILTQSSKIQHSNNSTLYAANLRNLRSAVKNINLVGTVNELVKLSNNVISSIPNIIIKSQSGTSLPIFNNKSLAASALEYRTYLQAKIKMNKETINFIGNRNIFLNNDILQDIKIKDSILYNNEVYSISTMSSQDKFVTSIISDFFRKINTGNISVQATTYSDKGKLWLYETKISTINYKYNDVDKSYSFGKYYDGSIFNYTKFIKDIDKFKTFLFELQSDKYNSLFNQIKSDYAEVYDIIFTGNIEKDIALLEDVYNKHKDTIRADFANKGFDFVEEIHISKNNKFNLELNFKLKVFNDKLLSDKYYDQLLTNFKNDITDINLDLPIFKTGNLNKNDIIDSYFWINGLYSSELNEFLTGGEYAHPSKSKTEFKTKSDSPTFIEDYINWGIEHIGSRWISQVKRMVIQGATYKPGILGLKNGISDEVRVAYVEDLKSQVYNFLGDKENLDVIDGAGFVNIYHARLMNNSLLDYPVGDDKKSIFHDKNQKYNNGVLVKWAEFALTNDRRKNSYNSPSSLELLFKNMNNVPINTTLAREFINNLLTHGTIIKYSDSFNPTKIYTIKSENGQIVKIHPDGTIESITLNITTLYDLDQFFGGAFSVDNNGNASEDNIKYVLDFIIRNPKLKKRYISYIIPATTAKVGQTNKNNSSMWTKETQLLTTMLSTRWGGVQLNSEHDLEESTISQMTQVLSSLAQGGFTSNITYNIYKDLGNIIYSQFQDWFTAISLQDHEKLYQIIGKALADSLKDKDTLGLAQSFIIKAKNIPGFKIPVYDGNIEGKFISTIAAEINKKGIRQKYEGIASVLTPSFNSMMYYNINGNNYLYSDLYKIENSLRHIGEVDWNGTFNNTTITSLLNDFKVINDQGSLVINPNVQSINRNDIRQGDWIWNESSLSWDILNTYEKYLKWKYSKNNQENIYKLIVSPRNLQGAQPVININTVDENGILTSKQFSLYDLDYSQILYSINHDDNFKLSDAIIILNNLGHNLTEEEFMIKDKFNKLKFLAVVKQLFQNELLNISQNKIRKHTMIVENLPTISEDEFIKVDSYDVGYAEIMMGRLHAKKFDLREGDQISDVKNEIFFLDRLKEKYVFDRDFEGSAVLYDDNGDKVIVKYNPDITSTNSSSHIFEVFEGNISYKDQDVLLLEKGQHVQIKDNIIEVSDINLLYKLTKSSDFPITVLSKDFIKYIKYIKDSNIDLSTMLNDYEDFIEKENKEFDSLLDLSEQAFNKQLKSIAKLRFQSFSKYIEYVGARIPAQSMQSFMPIKVVAFTNSYTNDVYVPIMQTFLQGSD